jgi:hypothetical protein
MAIITLCHCFRLYCISTMSIFTPKLVSDDVANSQRANLYHLVARRSRLQQLSEVEQRKLISAMANQLEPFGWSLTSSCKVFPISRDGPVTIVREKTGSLLAPPI